MTGVSMTAVVSRENIAVTSAPSTNAFRKSECAFAGFANDVDAVNQ
jgi:hypothetical protein